MNQIIINQQQSSPATVLDQRSTWIVYTHTHLGSLVWLHEDVSLSAEKYGFVTVVFLSRFAVSEYWLISCVG